jgi:hypothetical protein
MNVRTLISENGDEKKTVQLVSGERYRIRYRYAPQKRFREFVGTYMGESRFGGSEFNLRPDAGTSTLLPDAEIQSVEVVGRDVPHSAPVG